MEALNFGRRKTIIADYDALIGTPGSRIGQRPSQKITVGGDQIIFQETLDADKKAGARRRPPIPSARSQRVFLA